MSTSTYGGHGPTDPAERWAAYLVCRQRGHSADWAITQGWGPTRNVCKYCGTEYWMETAGHEANAPEEP